jgi:hypothetical protein
MRILVVRAARFINLRFLPKEAAKWGKSTFSVANSSKMSDQKIYATQSQQRAPPNQQAGLPVERVH